VQSLKKKKGKTSSLTSAVHLKEAQECLQVRPPIVVGIMNCYPPNLYLEGLEMKMGCHSTIEKLGLIFALEKDVYNSKRFFFIFQKQL